MSPSKRTAPSSVSAPNTPHKPSRSATQNKTVLKSGLLAGTSANKRKVSDALNDTPVSSQKKSKTTQTQKNRPKKDAAAFSGGKLSLDEYEDKPYSIECPAKRPKKNEAQEDAFRARDGETLGLQIDYAVRPGHWGAMKSFGQIKYNGLSFQRGDFAYFAKTLDAPEEVSEEEILASNDPLKYERDNFYVGMIAEARADDPQNVHVRILYAYWPEELPQGRQPYHGMKEVIISNHMDIMDAHTIIGKVEVQQIDESVENVDGIYWRQTLDISKLAPGKRKQLGLLSELKMECRCGQPMNPDKVLYVCRHCKIWYHEQCLIDDVLENAWEKYVAGTLGQDDEVTLKKEEDDSIEVALEQKKRSPLISGIANLASRLVGGSPAPTINATQHKAEIGTDTNVIKESQLDGPADLKPKKTPSAKGTPQGKGKSRKPGDPAQWDNKLSATIDTTGKFGKAGVVMAQIVDEQSGKVVWTTALSCLKCERRFD